MGDSLLPEEFCKESMHWEPFSRLGRGVKYEWEDYLEWLFDQLRFQFEKLRVYRDLSSQSSSYSSSWVTSDARVRKISILSIVTNVQSSVSESPNRFKSHEKPYNQSTKNHNSSPQPHHLHESISKDRSRLPHLESFSPPGRHASQASY